MRARHAIILSMLVCVACGPRPPAQEPGPEPPAQDPGSQADDPEPVEESASVDVEVEADPEEAAPPPAEPKDVEGSASGTEVKPMSVKDFDVSTEVDFDPSPAKEKKAAAIEKIGMATASTTDCYLELLTKQPELQGKIEITFTINPAGVPKAVKASTNTSGSTELGKCAVKSFKSKKFPKKLAGKKPVLAEVTITLLPYK